MTLTDFRKSYPQYDDMSDYDLTTKLHAKYYSDMPIESFYKKLDYAPNKNDDVSLTDTVSQMGKDFTSGVSRSLNSIKDETNDVANTYSQGQSVVPNRPDNFKEFVKNDTKEEAPQSIAQQVWDGVKHIAALPSNAMQEALSQSPTKTVDKALGGAATSLDKTYEYASKNYLTPMLNSILGTSDNVLTQKVNPYLEERRKQSENYVKGSSIGEVGAMSTDPLNVLLAGEGGAISRALQGAGVGSLMASRDANINNQEIDPKQLAANSILMGALTGGHALLSKGKTSEITNGMTDAEKQVAQGLSDRFNRPSETVETITDRPDYKTMDELKTYIAENDKGGQAQADFFEKQMDLWAKAENIRRAEEGRAPVTAEQIANDFILNYDKTKQDTVNSNSTLVDLQSNPRYQELMDMRRDVSSKDTQYSQALSQPRGTDADGNWYGASYDHNFNADFELTKADVKAIESGKATPEQIAKLRNDLGRLDNDPTYKQAPLDANEQLAANGELFQFVGAKDNEQGAFSDTTTRKVMKEIDDSGIITKLKGQSVKDDGKIRDYKLSDLMKHSSLYEKYPELMDVEVTVWTGKNRTNSGSQYGNKITVNANSTKSLQETLLHEIQHWIQTREQMPRGGSPKEFTPLVQHWGDTISRNAWYTEVKRNLEKYKGADYSAIENKIIQEYYDNGIGDWLPSREVRDWVHENFYNQKAISKLKEDASIIQSVTPKKEIDLYQRLYGEQQARATEYRKDMTPEQRAKESWQDTLKRVEGKYDEPIIRYDNNTLNQNIKGSYTIDKKLITMFESHDVSTINHELGHRFLFTLNAKERAIAEQVFGVKDGDWKVENHEAFADAYARYIADGKVQSAGIKAIFEKFKAFTKQLLLDLQANNGGKLPPMSKETKEFFKAMLGDEQARANLLEKMDGKEAKPLMGSRELFQEDYRMSHTAPRPEGANTGDNIRDVWGDDMYKEPRAWQWYGHGESDIMDKAAVNVIKSMKDNPNKEITIYRAVPKGIKEINQGDWVTTVKAYAKQHGESYLDKFDIIEKKVKASEIATDGNSVFEWGYHPSESSPNELFQTSKERQERLMEWHKDSAPETKNADGSPKVFYHQTNQTFDTFDLYKSYDGALWFTDNKSKIEKNETGASSHGKVMEVYLKAKKVAGWDEYDKYSIGELINKGYDGIKLDDDFIVFNPNQIKSVHNKGTFDQTNPNILYQIPQNLLSAQQNATIGHDVSTLKNVYEKAKEFTKEVVDSFKIQTPDYYGKMLDDRFTAIGKAQNDAETIHKALMQFSPETNKILQRAIVGDIKSLPQGYEVLQPIVDGVRAEIKRYTKQLVNLGMIDKDTALAYEDTYLKRSYASHYSDEGKGRGSKTVPTMHTRGAQIESADVDSILAFVNKRLDAMGEKEIINPMDITDIHDALQSRNLLDSSIAKGKFTWKETNGKVEVRTDWTKSERESMGEIENASVTVPTTLLKMNLMLENAKLMREVSHTAGHFKSEEEAIANGYERIPDTQRYGELRGMYVEKSIADDLKYAFEMEDTIFKTYKQATALWKMGKTVFNPVSHVNNFLGNVSTQLMLGRTMKESIEMVKETASQAKAFATDIREYESLHVKDFSKTLTPKETARYNVLKNELRYYIEGKENGLFRRGQITDILTKYNPLTNDFGGQGIVGETLKAINRAYQGGDDIPRLASYKVLRESGMGAKEAKEFVNSVFPDYSKQLPKGVRFLRDWGLSPFISWSYYVLPNIAKLAKAHPARALGLLSSVYLASYVMSGINPFGDEIPDKEQGRRVPISKDGTTVKVDRLIPGFDIASLPIDVVTKLANGLYHGKGVVALNDAVNAAGRDSAKLAQSYLMGGLPSSAFGLVNNIDPYSGRSISGDDSNSAKGAYNVFKYVLGTVSPALLTTLGGIAENQIAPSVRKKHSEVEPRTNMQEALKLLGINTLTYNTNEVEKKRRQQDRKLLK